MELWILIPLAAIAVGAFEQWLKFKAKQDKLGTSAAQLEKVVDNLSKQLEASEESREKLQQRVQNLETIVTSTDWDLVTSEHEKRVELDIPEESEAQAQAERIAKRVR
ncbi:MAG: hypothetical protein HKN13_05730 [Rhodothermales bacterium]|nr:hypothetical protein [Rhodothermales bacterium]